MSLIKLALDNSKDPQHKDYRGLKTKQVWAARGIGAIAGGAIGAIGGKGEGALLGGAIGAAAGDVIGRLKRMHEIAKKDKYKHPMVRTLLSNQAPLDLMEHTPAKSALAQLDLGTLAGGSVIRALNRK